MPTPTALLMAAWLIPLMGATLGAVLLWHRRVRANLVSGAAIALQAGSFACAAAALATGINRGEATTVLGTPLRLGRFDFELGIVADNLSLLMSAAVGLIATCVAVYARGYLRDEANRHVREEPMEPDVPGELRPGRLRTFYATLLLFVGCMQGLIVSPNLFQTFVFWELVGACSFLLIGFYRERPLAGPAAVKAFVVNRVGDVGMLVALMVLWGEFGTLSFAEFGAIERGPLCAAAAVGLFLGCVGKSAQLPLQTWLPDAMAGPTPVSALVHSATMVAAGVYLVARAYALFPAEVLLIVAYTGAATLSLAALFALAADDLKRILAWSTVSQLGYMMLAMGVGSPEAGVFHLLTHAFFKSLLFLGAGAVIHATHQTNISQMGGLARRMPWTCGLMAVGCVAIAGLAVPGTGWGLSGYYSKDAILEGSLEFVRQRPKHGLLFALPLATAALTALYMGRLFFRVFLGVPRSLGADHAHPTEGVMLAPMVVLAALAALAGFGGAEGPLARAVAGPQVDGHASHDPTAATLGLIAAFGGLLAAYLFYVRRSVSSEKLRSLFPESTQWLRRGGRFDEVYDAVAVAPARKTGRGLWHVDADGIDRLVEGLVARTVSLARWDDRLDRGLVDGAVEGVGRLANVSGDWLRGLQSGSVRQYALLLGVGLLSALVVAFSFLPG